MEEYFDGDQRLDFTLAYTIEPFLDSLEERGAGPREALELVEYFETIFEEQLVSHVETIYSNAYQEANPDGCMIYLDGARFNAVNEGGKLTFTAEEEPAAEDFAAVRDSLESALDQTFGWWSQFSTIEAGDRLAGYTFRPAYRWEDGQLVIDEDNDGEGLHERWAEQSENEPSQGPGSDAED